MKRKFLKRCLCAALAAAMMIPLSACGKKEPPMASKDNIFATTEIEMPQKFDYVQEMIAGEDRVFLIGSNYESSGEGDNYKWKNQTIMSIVDFDGKPIKNIVLNEDSSEKQESGEAGVYRNFSRMCVDNKGNIALLVNEYSWNMDTGESTEKFSVCKYDKEGNSSGEISLDNIKPEDSDYFYISDMSIDNAGNIIICSDNAVYVLDSSGKLAFTVKGEDNTNNSGSYMNGVYRTADGRVVALVNSYEIKDDNYTNKMTAKILDMEKREFSGEYELNSRWYRYYNGGGDYDLYVSNDNALMGVNIETGEATTIIDWLKSGFDTNTLESVTILPDGRLLAVTYKYESNGGGYSWGGNGMILTLLNKLDPSEIPDKKLISLSAFYLDWNVKQRIVEFNKNSLEYQIEVNTYSDYDDGSGSYSAGVTKLNNDLIAGNIPDILLVDSSMSFDSYVSKGMIADLYTYIDKDPDIKREDYLENVFNAFSKNGKLYRIAPSFNIQTLVCKSKFLDGKQSWTMQDYLDLAAANPDKDMMSYEQTKEGFLTSMLSCGIDAYVDWEKGRCSFDGDAFKTLLEAANAYPLEYSNDNNYDETYWMQRETAYREDRALISAEYFYNFNRLRELEDATFGEPVTFIGYPNDNGSGAVISPTNQLAITKKAKNPDGAWEFVRYFLTDECQSNVSGFPVKLSAYDKLMEDAKKKPTYKDENGNDVEYDNTRYLGGTEIKIGVNTDEDNERMMDLIKSADMLYQYDQDLMKIITEEAAAYFNNQKTVDEVANIIQNRATTYINEGM